MVPGNFSTAMLTDMPDIKCRIVSTTPFPAVARSEQWLDRAHRPSDDVKWRSRQQDRESPPAWFSEHYLRREA